MRMVKFHTLGQTQQLQTPQRQRQQVLEQQEQPQRALAQGGQGVTARWAWFAYDGQLYQLAVYASAARAAQAQSAMDSLISGLRLP